MGGSAMTRYRLEHLLQGSGTVHRHDASAYRHLDGWLGLVGAPDRRPVPAEQGA